MVERLGIAFAEGLQVRPVEDPALYKLGEDDEQAVGVGDIPGHQSLVDHRQVCGVLVVHVVHVDRLDFSAWRASPAKPQIAFQAAAFSASGQVKAALDEGRSMKAGPVSPPRACRPIAAAVLPLNATARSRGCVAI